MQAIGMRAMARRIADFSHDRKTRLYYAACICLLVAAAGLRFHDLSEHQLRFDEAVVANHSKGTFSETIFNTRYRHSSPILYPLVLYAVQKVESSIFSIRIVPATASVLTMAALLFFAAALGVSRRAAFLAALLATLSVEAIRHAQDAREYSIDALLAVLMIAGLLWYLCGTAGRPCSAFRCSSRRCSSTVWSCSALPSLAPPSSSPASLDRKGGVPTLAGLGTG